MPAAAPTQTPATVTLHHLHGSHKGSTQHFDLHEGKSVVFGRLPSSEIAFDPLQDIKASGRHARLFRQGGRCMLEDLRSSNGTFINGLRLEMAPAPIRSGDIIEFGGGGPRVRVTYEDPAAPPPAVDVHSQTLPLQPKPADPSAPSLPTPDPAALTVDALPPPPEKPVIARPTTLRPVLTRPPTLRPATSPHADGDGDPAAVTQPEAPPQPPAPPPEPQPPPRRLTPLLDPPPAPTPDLSPADISQMIHDAQRDQSKRTASMMIVTAAVLLLVIAVLTIFIARSKHAQSQLTQAQATLDALQRTLTDTQASLTLLQDDLARAQQRLHDLDALRASDHADRLALLTRLDTEAALRRQHADALTVALAQSMSAVQVQLSAQRQDTAALTGEATVDVSQARADAVFWLTADGRVQDPTAEDGKTQCVAFAIHPDGWLATSASCLHDLLTLGPPTDAPSPPPTPTALRGDVSFPLDLDSAHFHPLYTHLVSPDVGIVRVVLPDGQRLPPASLAPLAPRADALALSLGQTLYALTPPLTPSAPPTLRGGNIAHLMPLPHAASGAALPQWVWHTTLGSARVSGAPLFDRQGRVVAISSGLMGLDQVTDSDGQRVEVRRVFAADAVRFAVRVDLLHDLLQRHNILLPLPAGAQP